VIGDVQLLWALNGDPSIQAWAKPGPDGDPDWSTINFGAECPPGFVEVAIEL
jgi:hypothetical protein